jgi:hypothetical protein
LQAVVAQVAVVVLVPYIKIILTTSLQAEEEEVVRRAMVLANMVVLGDQEVERRV